MSWLFVLVLAGCETQVWDFDAGVAATGRPSGDAETSTACEAGACPCPSEQLRCSGTCVDPKTSVQHCGACNQACPGGQLCQNGQCQ